MENVGPASLKMMKGTKWAYGIYLISSMSQLMKVCFGNRFKNQIGTQLMGKLFNINKFM